MATTPPTNRSAPARDVVLVYPATGMDLPGKTISLPLSLLHPAALLDANGFRVRLLDQRVEPDWRAQLVSELRRGPLLVGISAMTGPQIASGLEAARLVREHSRAPLVWGGIHATLTPLQTLANPLVDVVVVGEGERALFDVATALAEGRRLDGIPGLALRVDGEARLTPERPLEDLDDLPPVPYHLVDLAPYFFDFNLPGPTLSLLGGRGCRHRCGFCYSRRFNRGHWRGRSPEVMVAGIEQLVSFGARNVFVCDDDFFYDRARAARIFERMLERRVPASIITTCRADDLTGFDDRMLQLMKRVGVYVSIGVESGSPRTLRLIRKGITVQQVLTANQRLRAAGIGFNFSFVGGFPTETWADLDQTIDLMLRLQDENPAAKLTNLKIFTPLPGTDLLDLAVKHGFEPPTDLEGWSRYHHHVANFRWGSEADARRLERLSWLTYFLDGAQMQTMFGTTPARRAFIAAYSRVARARCRRHLYRGMPEIDVLRLLFEHGVGR